MTEKDPAKSCRPAAPDAAGEPPGGTARAAGVPGLKSWLPLIALAGLMALVFGMGWHHHLSLETIAANRDLLKAFLERHTVLARAVFVLLYTVAIALSLPGGLVLTLAGGLLFGWFLGGLLAVIAATAGATVVFLVARSSFGAALAQKAGPWLSKLRQGFQENALSYLLFLRLVPAFPFWLVNLAPALLGMPLKTYVLGTFLGIIPGTFAFASAGAGLDSIIAAARDEQAACLAKGAHDCKLAINASALVTKELLIAFALLGLMALIPMILKRWRMRNAAV